MPFTVSNQTPVDLSFDYSQYINLDKPGNPVYLFNSNFSKTLFTNKNTQITYQNKNLTPDNITDLVTSCLTDNVNPGNEKLAKMLISQTVNYYQISQLPIRLLYGEYQLLKANLPLPSNRAYYTVNSDIIPQCKKYLATNTNIDALAASFIATFKLNTFGYAFKDSQQYQLFLQKFKKYTAKFQNKLSVDTINKLNQLYQSNLTNKLTENYLLRNTDQDDQDPYSFSRLLIKFLLKSQSNKQFPIIYDTGEFYNPKSIIFVNIDYTAHQTPQTITKHYQDIKASLQFKVKILNSKSLNKLPNAARIKRKAMQKAQKMQQQISEPNYKASNSVQLLTTKPSQKWLAKTVLLILKKMTSVNQSQNTYKSQKRSFNKPNRRHPDDFNLAGKITHTDYKPDLHIYLDTSGSISEEDYRAGIKSLITMAKKLDINLYFNSFSHYLSPCVNLPLKGKSTMQIYNLFKHLPKADGGTDFENVWNYINKSKKRKQELSLIITDFGYYAPNQDFKHPQNLYYLPIDNDDYANIRQMATEFIDSVKASGLNIRNHCLL